MSDELGAALRRVTKFRVECPACGRVGIASWTREPGTVVCRGCGARFSALEHTYRPVTRGMSDEERRERERERQRAYDGTPGRRRHNRENRMRYYREHREEERRKMRERYRRKKEGRRA